MKLFLLPSSIHLISGFFPQWYAGTSPLDSQTSTKALSSVGNYQNQCSEGEGSRKLLFHPLAAITLLTSVLSLLPISVTELCDAMKEHCNTRYKPISASCWLPNLWKVEASSLSKFPHLLNTF